ncbi:MAG: cytochrome-c oxidase [Rhodobacter sp.]|nr:cytochrome-c oxidase [Rhodobacter sp.]
MTISKGFLIIGAVYLVIGMSLGIWMGANEAFTLAPVHAHINLVGFTLMTLFGLAYRVIPALNTTLWGRLHFWLFQIGGLVLLVSLYLLVSQTLPGATIGPVLAISEMVVLAGVVAFLFNLFKSA